jgi:hypothetical protein
MEDVTVKAMQWVLTVVAVVAALSTTPVTASADTVLTAFGLTADQRLVRFRTDNPSRLRIIGNVFGLRAPDTKLVGIDFRIQDKKLYGVGDKGGIYTINTNTAQATLAPAPVSRLTVPLDDGASFGVDFNPAADALRIVSNTDQNLRHPFAGPLVGQTQTDGKLNYPVPAGATAPDPAITGVAYTNNDIHPNTGTTLFGIDTSLNQVVIQSPPNAGSLVATGYLTVDPDTSLGFDIYSSRRTVGSPTGNNLGFASIVAGGVTGLYRINLLTGRAALIWTIPHQVVDIAIRPSLLVP